MSRILGFLKANPAIAAGLVSAAITLGARFGLSMSADQLAAFAAIITAASHGVVHLSTPPPVQHGEHEKPQP